MYSSIMSFPGSSSLSLRFPLAFSHKATTALRHGTHACSWQDFLLQPEIGSYHTDSGYRLGWGSAPHPTRQSPATQEREADSFSALQLHICLPVSRIQTSHLFTFSTMDSSNQTQDHGKYTLPSDFLSGPASNLVIERIDFSKTALPEYNGLYATIIDNALSEAECNALIRAAEAHTDGEWSQAKVNLGFGREKVITDTRDCGRIIWDDPDVVGKIWARISSSVPEIEFIETAARITGNGPQKRGEKYQMTRLNERIRFLKYGAGQYFRRKPNNPPSPFSPIQTVFIQTPLCSLSPFPPPN